MAPALEEVAAATERNQMEAVITAAEKLMELFPWARTLDLEDVVQMARDISNAAREWRRSGNPAPFQEVLDDWQATAEAWANPGFQTAIARRERRFVPWTD